MAETELSNRFAALADLEEEESDGDLVEDPPSPKRDTEKGKKGQKNKQVLFPVFVQQTPEFIQHWTALENVLKSYEVVQLQERLAWLRLEPQKPSPKHLQRLLSSKYKKLCAKIFSENSRMARHFRNNMARGLRNQYNYDFLVVIDFEATCEKENAEDFQHEIIQFPAVLVDVQQQVIVDEFNSYCKPKINPQLSEFCTSLTGISQETIDSARYFPDVLKDFQKWLYSHGLGLKHTFSLVADGFCDMGKFLYTQCVLSGVEYPSYAFQWIDIRLLFFQFYGVKWYKLPVTLELLGERFHGTLHNGLDDSKNIGAILLKMIKAGANPIQNERILLDIHDQERNPPAHKYDLRTVQYIHPREAQYNQNGRFGYRGKSFNHHYTQERSFNKENWTNRVWSPTLPKSTASPSPERRVNKLKNALREASMKNGWDESASLKTMESVVPNSMKSEPSTSRS